MILLILKTSRTHFQPNGPKVAKKIGFQLCFRLFLSFYSTQQNNRSFTTHIQEWIP